MRLTQFGLTFILSLAGVLGVAALDGHAPAGKKVDPWPYPQDVPKAAGVSVSPAGVYPADISRYLQVSGAGSATLSPDGSHVVFLSRVTGTPQVWRVAAEGGQPEQLTFGGGVTFVHWHPDNQHLIYGADNNGDEREAYYLLSADGLRERQLLPFSSGYRQFGAFNGDGSWFTYASTERNGRDFDIWTAPTSSEGAPRLVYEGTFGFMPLAWQPGGDLIIVGETRGEDANNLHGLNVTTGEMTPLKVPEVAAYYGSVTFSADGQKLYLVHNEDRDFQMAAVMDVATGTFSEIAQANADIDQLVHRGTTTAWSVNSGGYSLLRVKTARTLEDGALEDGALEEVSDLPEGVYGLDLSADGSRLMARVTGPDRAGDIYVKDLKSGQLFHTFKSNLAGVGAKTIVKPHAITFTAKDGLTVHGLLYKPMMKPHVMGFPVVVNVHGGPAAQSRPTFNPVIQYLVGKGIAVLDINVRGSTGYGKKYAWLDNREKRLDSVRDLRDAVDWMRGEPELNAERVAVMGASYGGYMVNAVMGAYPGVFRAGASFVGVSNWVRALEEAGPALKASDRIEYGDIREQKWQDFYRDNSPINTAPKIEGAMFFEHGVNDPRDPVTESDRMVKLLREKGQDVVYLRFPDEGHSVTKQENRLVFYRQLAAFLEQQLAQK